MHFFRHFRKKANRFVKMACNLLNHCVKIKVLSADGLAERLLRQRLVRSIFLGGTSQLMA